MISVSPVGVEDIEVVTLELEEDVGEAKEEMKVTAVATVEKKKDEEEEEEEEEEIVEIGRVRKRRTVRRSTGVGGKAPHLAISFRQVRKSLPVASRQVKVKEVPEYFDVEDEEEEDEEGVDDVQVR